MVGSQRLLTYSPYSLVSKRTQLWKPGSISIYFFLLSFPPSPSILSHPLQNNTSEQHRYPSDIFSYPILNIEPFSRLSSWQSQKKSGLISVSVNPMLLSTLPILSQFTLGLINLYVPILGRVLHSSLLLGSPQPCHSVIWFWCVCFCFVCFVLFV